ncbi:MarR family transcriptional regulator [Algoriphagus sp. NG3]|uniref:MarR family winged helix-turn-helix transcriptional regulator n=1 Tax=Algoriphagus sp. NG3 TaxID=3097546 RepID=UPI002A8306BA|nr:MarR family transcriptional regulator [Algoriphagus sp. NG3]WPR74529.1 MarR family transcriptional regulator [Algoriphagus sp. NG3]
MSQIHQLSLSLYSSSRLLIQLIQAELNELGLTYPQYLVMMVLWEKDSLKVNEIGSRLYLDSGTLTPLLKKLERVNYVKRSRNEADERTVIIELTYPGKSLQGKVEAQVKALDKKIQEIADNVDNLNQTLQHLLVEIESLKNTDK